MGFSIRFLYSFSSPAWSKLLAASPLVPFYACICCLLLEMHLVFSQHIWCHDFAWISYFYFIFQKLHLQEWEEPRLNMCPSAHVLNLIWILILIKRMDGQTLCSSWAQIISAFLYLLHSSINESYGNGLSCSRRTIAILSSKPSFLRSVTMS